MKIAILYICTGKYSIFWEDFYASSEKCFLPDCEKTYFVFTDNKHLEYSTNNNVKIIKQNKLGWPFDTLDRFKMFRRIIPELSNTDYTFFFNANSVLIAEIKKEEIICNKPLIGALHPCFYDKTSELFIYERNKHSKAYIPFGEGNHYFMGAFNGGKSEYFIDLIQTLSERIEHDKKNNIIAIWHDESHLNKYYYENSDKVNVLSPSYVYPEEMNLPFEKKNLLRDKNQLGGHKYLRDINSNLFTKNWNRLSNLLLKLFNGNN